MRKKETKQTSTTSCQYYAFQVMEREDDFNTLLKSRSLMAQFVVDMYAKVTFCQSATCIIDIDFTIIPIRWRQRGWDTTDSTRKGSELNATLE